MIQVAKQETKLELRDLGPSKKKQHYVNKLNFKDFIEKNNLLLSIISLSFYYLRMLFQNGLNHYFINQKVIKGKNKL